MLTSNGSSTKTHLRRETLGLYALGDLAVRETLATEQHLSGCARCKKNLRQVEAVVAALRQPVLESPAWAASRG